jgi:hypothetical protein
MSPNLRWAWVTAARRATHCALLISAALIVQGCAATPQRPLTGLDPADPDARVPATSYRSVLRNRHGVQPAEPSPWSAGDPSRSDKEKP